MGTSRLSARLTFLVFGVGVFALLLIPRPVDAAVHNVSGYAWSSTLGWISMDCNNPGNTCTDPVVGDWGLDLDAQKNLSGYAWSSNAGWICFGATCNTASAQAAGAPSGTPGLPDSPASAADHYCIGNVICARYDSASPNKNLHGWAYVLGMTDGADYRGWISLNCTDIGTNTASPHSCPGSDYGVTYVEEATQPAGEFYGYAWNGNVDTTGSGWIQFGCSDVEPIDPPPYELHATCGAPGEWGVKSAFVDTGWDDVAPIEGIFSPSPATPAEAHLTDIPVVFTVFSAPAGAIIRCGFTMSDGTHREFTRNVATRQAKVPTYGITYTVTSADKVVDASGNPILWKFGASDGVDCEVQAIPSKQKTVDRRIATHPATWTFAGPAGAAGIDSVRAKYCLDGSTDMSPTRSYFENTAPDGANVQCDTEGDLAFTLLKARGIPVEIRCYDGVDGDANSQADGCIAGTTVVTADSNCRGIAYLCITHPPASAPLAPKP